MADGPLPSLLLDCEPAAWNRQLLAECRRSEEVSAAMISAPTLPVSGSTLQGRVEAALRQALDAAQWAALLSARCSPDTVSKKCVAFLVTASRSQDAAMALLDIQ